MLVSSKDICNIVNKLKCGKSSGPGGISAESLKFSYSFIWITIIMFFTVLNSWLSPINPLWRPLLFQLLKINVVICRIVTIVDLFIIAIATITSKVSESLILVKCE